ncbi:MAG: hypothetical protein KGM95_09855, partial [Betaproteobacteria bacterium]|nr:hypothetical protein [Betaproteobacteria bacterium]
TGRGQILTILPANSCSIGQKSGEIWTGRTLLQPISFKSDRLPGTHFAAIAAITATRPSTRLGNFFRPIDDFCDKPAASPPSNLLPGYSISGSSYCS